MLRKWLSTKFNVASKKKPIRRSTGKLALTKLEDRCVPALIGTNLTGGVLTFTFDNANDSAYIVQSGAGNTFVRATPGGTIISPITPTASVTAIRVIAGEGNDLIDASGVLATTPVTISGGLGDDTLIGNSAANVIYGDDVPVQTFSSADPLTTTQAVGGAGATWVSIPSSLFAQRQVQRFNNTTANVGGGAWTVSGNPTATMGISRLNYRQNNAGATIDLSGIASMSFDINVTGSVTGYWNLMDTDGYILEVPGGFALAAGTHTVTLDFSTAAIDDGFDLSAVTGMTVQLSGIQAGESATVTNLRKGELLVATTGGNDVIDGRGGADQLFGQAGDDRFDISNARDAFGDLINGGSGLDTVKIVTTTDIVLTDFRTTNALGTQTVFGVEQFDGNNTVNLANEFAANPALVKLFARSGTPGTHFNLTSVGQMTIGGVPHTIWRMENGTAASLPVTLTGYGYGSNPIFSGTLPAMTDTFVASPFVGTHQLTNGTYGTKTKAAGTPAFSYVYSVANKGILGRNALPDGVGNDTDALDFTGINFIGGLTTINLRSGNDQYIGGNTALTVNGGSGNDTMSAGVGGGALNGDAGMDTLYGGIGATTLNGGAGIDALYSGTGFTTYLFNINDLSGGNEDLVYFFKAGDKLAFNLSIFTGAPTTGFLEDGATASGTGSSSRIRRQVSGSDTILRLPNASQNRSIRLVGFTGALAESDFILS